MGRSRSHTRTLVAWLERFGPLALLVVATVVAGAASITTAPTETAGHRTPAPPHPSSIGTTTSVPTPTVTTVLTTTPTTTPTPTPTGHPGGSTLPWGSMENGLELGPDSVSCPSTRLCVFTGRATQFAGQQERALSVSTGPFIPGRPVTGHLTDLPLAVGEADTDGPWYVSCPSTTVCIMSSPDAVYATASPLTGPWVLQLTAPSGQGFGDISCAGITFCAVLLGNDILISRSPLGGAGTWSRNAMMDLPPDEDEGVSVLSCPSPRLCVAGGEGGFVGGWIEESTDPGGGAGAWSGGEVTNPGSPQHSWEYSIEAVSCPTTAFCVAVEDGGPLLVSSDPASGPASWHLAPTTYGPSSYEAEPGVASCSNDGTCLVSGAGIFPSSAGAAGPGFAGYPPFQVSCVTASFCVSIDSETDNQLAVGGISGTARS